MAENAAEAGSSASAGLAPALPVAEFIEDVPGFMKGKSVDPVIAELNEKYKALKLLEQQMMQRKARLMTKLPEIQKARDMVVKLIEVEGKEMTMDFELGPSVYSKAKLSNVTSVNLWLGAGVMVEYPLEEAKELLDTNLATCKANLNTAQSDLAFLQESATTTEVSIARIYNYDVERRRLQKESGQA